MEPPPPPTSSSSPAPVPPPPPPPVAFAPPRPPSPPWTVWMAFLCGPALVSMGVSLLEGGRFRPENLLAFGVLGLILGLPFLGGLAIATRFFSGPVSRIVGGLVFGVLLIVASGAAAFAGCMCILQGTK